MVEPQSDYARIKGEVRTTSRGRTSIHVDVQPEGDRSVVVVSGRISLRDSGRGYWRRIDNPPVYAGEVLRAQLQQVGVTVKGKVKVGRAPADTSALEKLVELTSPRLAELLTPWFTLEASVDIPQAESSPVFKGKERWQVWKRKL